SHARRLDLHQDRRELGEDVDLLVLEALEPEEQQRRSRGHDEPAEPQARTDDPAHLEALGRCYSPSTPTSTPRISSAPTVTTRVPWGGPLFRIAVPPLKRSTTIGARTYWSGAGFVYV